MATLSQLASELKVARKIRRAGAHVALLKWAERREYALKGLGWPPCSMLEKFRREGAGASQNSGPGQMTSVEKAANWNATVLQIERLVRDLPAEWQEVVAGRYIGDLSTRIIGEILGLEHGHIWVRLADAQERIGLSLETFGTLMKFAAGAQ